MKKIDAHAHIGRLGGVFDVKISAKELIERMEDYNIEKTVLCSYDNEEVREAVEEHPNRLIGKVWIDPTEGEEAVEKTYHYVEDVGFKGIKLHPLLQSYRANAEIVHPIAETARELEALLFIHSGHPLFSLPWSIAQLAEKYPEVKIVMLHMGHGNAIYIQAAIDMAKKFDNIYLETSGMPMHTKIKEAYQEVGSNRIMFGTDVPCHHHSVEIQKVKVSGLKKEELKNIFYTNVKGLLDL